MQMIHLNCSEEKRKEKELFFQKKTGCQDIEKTLPTSADEIGYS